MERSKSLSSAKGNHFRSGPGYQDALVLNVKLLIEQNLRKMDLFGMRGSIRYFSVNFTIDFF